MRSSKSALSLRLLDRVDDTTRCTEYKTTKECGSTQQDRHGGQPTCHELFLISKIEPEHCTAPKKQHDTRKSHHRKSPYKIDNGLLINLN